MNSDNNSARVLVAEDNRVMANVIRFNLQRSGFDVTIVHDGKAALKALESQRFDIVITDYQMPHATGDDICRYVRCESDQKEIPVVLVSAKGLELKSGSLISPERFSGVIYKPFSPREIIRIAHEVLDVSAQS